VERKLLHAMAHITGGGFRTSSRACCSSGLGVVVRLGSWPVRLCSSGCGARVVWRRPNVCASSTWDVGLVLIVDPAQESAVKSHLRDHGLESWVSARSSPDAAYDLRRRAA
jgi:phosphoribosylformylglycinamidine cyclo-ligase